MPEPLDPETRSFLEWLTFLGYASPLAAPGGRWAAVKECSFTALIVQGRLGDHGEFDRRWSYPTTGQAQQALRHWAADGFAGEPPASIWTAAAPSRSTLRRLAAA